MSAASIVKFKVQLVSRELPRDDRISQLSRWCARLNDSGLMPKRGARSLGNLSFRLGPGSPVFVITASALSSKENLQPSDFVIVMESDPRRRIVVAAGARDPSSESMIHYEIYKCRKEVNAVFHGHDKDITTYAALLDLPETAKEEPAGSPELLNQVMKVLHDENFLVMKNHGFLSLGKSMEQAGNLALQIKREIDGQR